MNLAVALIYWLIVFIWLTVLGTLLAFYIKNPRVFGTTRLLLAVVAIDTSRNIIENVYFGLYFGGQYGVFPAVVTTALRDPIFLIITKIMNVAAGCVVLSLLLLRWLPSAVREHKESEKNVDDARSLTNLMDEFVANVSHELRTPLTAIAGSLGLVAAGAAGQLPTPAARLISIAHSNAQRLVRLINDILDIGKIESGMMTLDFKPVDLRATAERTIEDNRVLADGRGVSVSLEMTSTDCMVRADADRLTQVLTNLLSNAIKFSPQGGQVVVAITRHGHSGRVVVRDHGPGIPDEFRSRIFGKFEQARRGDKRQKGGSGLGLNIVAKIVAQHGGKVGFEDAPVVGTIFYFEIPLWEPVEVKTSVLPPAEARAVL